MMIWTLAAALSLTSSDFTQDRVMAVPPPPPEGMLTGYLKIPDIDGESESDSGEDHLDYLVITMTNATDHEEEIDILSIDWTTAGAVRVPYRARGTRMTPRSSSGTATGKRIQRPFTVPMTVPGATPLLVVDGKFGSCTVGQKAPRMIVSDGSETWTAHDVEVVACGRTSTSGEADDRPTEEVAFYYNKIAFSYAKKDMVLKGKKILEN